MPNPFIPNFTVAQTPQNPAIVVIADTSTGTPTTPIVSKRIYVKDYLGNYIVPAGVNTNYIEWDIVDNPLTLNLLTQDVAVNIKVEWLDSLDVEYELDNNYCFSEFNKQFLYYLIQLQSMTYNIIQDTNYWGNVSTFWINVIGAVNSVEIGNDIYASQVCLNRATFMAQNQSNFF